MKAFVFSAEASIYPNIQMNLPPPRYPLLQRMWLRLPLADLDGNSRPDYLLLLNYPDRCVIEATDSLKDVHRKLFEFSIATPNRQLLDLNFPLWNVPGSGHHILTMRATNKQQGDEVTDTLYFYDIDRKSIVRSIPVGSTLSPLLVGGHLQESRLEDSLLVLLGLDDGWLFLPRVGDGLDGAHQYLIAYRPDGSIAWRRVLDDSLTRKKMRLSLKTVHGFGIVTGAVNANPTDADSTLIQLHDRRNGRELARDTLPSAIVRLHSHITPKGEEQLICVAKDGSLYVLDSLLRLLDQKRLPFRCKHSDGENVAGPMEFDLDSDGVNDWLVRSIEGDAVVISGADYHPLGAVQTGTDNSTVGIVRVKGRPSKIFVGGGTKMEMFDLAPTPFLTRLEPWRGTIISIFLLLAVLPAGAYAVRRIHYLRTLFASLTTRNETQGALVVAGNGRVKALNAEARRMLGMANADHTRNGVVRVEMLPAEIRTMIDHCRKTGIAENRDIILNVDGVRYLTASVSPIRALASRRGCVLKLTEATSHVEAELRRNILWLARSIAHDAKHPLGTIDARFKTMMMLLTRDVPMLPPQVDEYATIIRNNLMGLSDSILKIMWLADTIDNAPAKYSLSSLMDRWLQGNRHRYERSDIVVSSEIPLDLPQVTVDYSHFAVMLQCICDNAAEAMSIGEEKKIAFNAAHDGGGVLLTIADTGPGMDRETLDRMLTSPYFTTKEHGTGIGMKIIRKVCEEHRLHLKIESVPGSGTIVVLRFPANGHTTDVAAHQTLQDVV
jgi:signal transduction histidine kinase